MSVYDLPSPSPAELEIGRQQGFDWGARDPTNRGRAADDASLNSAAAAASTAPTEVLLQSKATQKKQRAGEDRDSSWEENCGRKKARHRAGKGKKRDAGSAEVDEEAGARRTSSSKEEEVRKLFHTLGGSESTCRSSRQPCPRITVRLHDLEEEEGSKEGPCYAIIHFTGIEKQAAARARDGGEQGDAEMDVEAEGVDLDEDDGEEVGRRIVKERSRSGRAAGPFLPNKTVQDRETGALLQKCTAFTEKVEAGTATFVFSGETAERWMTPSMYHSTPLDGHACIAAQKISKDAQRVEQMRSRYYVPVPWPISSFYTCPIDTSLHANLLASVKANCLANSIRNKEKTEGGNIQLDRVPTFMLPRTQAVMSYAIAVVTARAKSMARKRFERMHKGGVVVAAPEHESTFNVCASIMLRVEATRAQRLDTEPSSCLLPVVCQTACTNLADLPTRLNRHGIDEEAFRLAVLEMDPLHETISQTVPGSTETIKNLCFAILSARDHPLPKKYAPTCRFDPKWAAIILVVFLAGDVRGRHLLDARLSDVDIAIAQITEAYGRKEMHKRENRMGSASHSAEPATPCVDLQCSVAAAVCKQLNHLHGGATKDAGCVEYTEFEALAARSFGKQSRAGESSPSHAGKTSLAKSPRRQRTQKTPLQNGGMLSIWSDYARSQCNFVTNTLVCKASLQSINAAVRSVGEQIPDLAEEEECVRDKAISHARWVRRNVNAVLDPDSHSKPLVYVQRSAAKKRGGATGGADGGSTLVGFADCLGVWGRKGLHVVELPTADRLFQPPPDVQICFLYHVASAGMDPITRSTRSEHARSLVASLDKKISGGAEDDSEEDDEEDQNEEDDDYEEVEGAGSDENNTSDCESARSQRDGATAAAKSAFLSCLALRRALQRLDEVKYASHNKRTYAFDVEAQGAKNNRPYLPNATGHYRAWLVANTLLPDVGSDARHAKQLSSQLVDLYKRQRKLHPKPTNLSAVPDEWTPTVTQSAPLDYESTGEPACTPTNAHGICIRISEALARFHMREQVTKSAKTAKDLCTHQLLPNHPQQRAIDCELGDSNPVPYAFVTDVKMEQLPEDERAEQTADAGKGRLAGPRKDVPMAMAVQIACHTPVRVVDVVQSPRVELEDGLQLLIFGALQAIYMNCVAHWRSWVSLSYTQRTTQPPDTTDVTLMPFFTVDNTAVARRPNVATICNATPFAQQSGSGVDSGAVPFGTEAANINSDHRLSGRCCMSMPVANTLFSMLMRSALVPIGNKKFTARPDEARGLPRSLRRGVWRGLDRFDAALEKVRDVWREENPNEPPACGEAEQADDLVWDLMVLPLTPYAQQPAGCCPLACNDVASVCRVDKWRTDEGDAYKPLVDGMGKQFITDATMDSWSIATGTRRLRPPSNCRPQECYYSTAVEEPAVLFGMAALLAQLARLLNKGAPPTQQVESLKRLLDDFVRGGATPEFGSESEGDEERYRIAAAAVVALAIMYPCSWETSEPMIEEWISVAAPACMRRPARLATLVARSTTEKDDAEQKRLRSVAEDLRSENALPIAPEVCGVRHPVTEEHVLQARRWWSAFSRQNQSAWDEGVAPIVVELAARNGTQRVGKKMIDEMRALLDKAICNSWRVHSRDGTSPPPAPCPLHDVLAPEHINADHVNPRFSRVAKDLPARGALVGMKGFQARQCLALLGAYDVAPRVQVYRFEGQLTHRVSNDATVFDCRADGTITQRAGRATNATGKDKCNLTQGTIKDRFVLCNRQRAASDKNILVQLPLLVELTEPAPFRRRHRSMRDAWATWISSDALSAQNQRSKAASMLYESMCNPAVQKDYFCKARG